ncbi:MAG: hypothetical protein H8E29_11005 [Anaerolineales bacterium]|uniref:Uncharacterized protein n=1 Tax=Candidatus Desulfolinea nitratireducens TaxID=2841698 RepID=A0A8J6TG01_9CHLR|nr:hypothetical protein [Candidatus Desulfolinea nitratireducens]
MTSKSNDSAWTTKGGTLSHKTAQKEFGLTFDEIVAGINAGKLQYRENNTYGSPFLRLIRSEVEALVDEKYGKNYLNKKKWKKELSETKKTLKALKAQMLGLETRKAELLALLSDKDE